MIGCLGTSVRKQPIIALYFESETVLKFYNLEARTNKVLVLILVQTVFEKVISRLVSKLAASKERVKIYAKSLILKSP